MDWRTRLAVVFRKPGSSDETVISPIDSFSPTFALDTEIIHSIERSHVGVIYSPENITFTMSVKAIGPVAAQLTAIATQGQRFDIVLQEQDGMGEDWSFSEVVLSDCIITSAEPSAVSAVGVPTASFSGLSMGASIAGKPQEGGPDRVNVPEFG